MSNCQLTKMVGVDEMETFQYYHYDTIFFYECTTINPPATLARFTTLHHSWCPLFTTLGVQLIPPPTHTSQVHHSPPLLVSNSSPHHYYKVLLQSQTPSMSKQRKKKSLPSDADGVGVAQLNPGMKLPLLLFIQILQFFFIQKFLNQM